MEFLKFSITIWLYPLFAVNNCVQAKRDFTIEIDELQLGVVPSLYVKNSSSFVTDKKMITIDFQLNRNISDWHMLLHFSIPRKGKDSRPITLLQLDIDACQCLNAGCKNNFVYVLFKEIIRTSNFPRKCPLVVNQAYSVSNYTVRDEDYPPIIPDSKWLLSLDVSFDGKLNAKILIKGRVRRI